MSIGDFSFYASGHKSLALYEWPGSESSGSVTTSLAEVDKLQPSSSSSKIPASFEFHNHLYSRGIGTIKFSPQKINIGVGFREFASSEVDEFDSIVAQMPIDNFD